MMAVQRMVLFRMGRTTGFFAFQAEQSCRTALNSGAAQRICLAQTCRSTVPQVSKPAVSPASKPAHFPAASRFGNLRHAKQIRRSSAALPGARGILSCVHPHGCAAGAELGSQPGLDKN
jgi:hypothetical protein